MACQTSALVLYQGMEPDLDRQCLREIHIFKTPFASSVRPISAICGLKICPAEQIH
jgi:hypothetical protein